MRVRGLQAGVELLLIAVTIRLPRLIDAKIESSDGRSPMRTYLGRHASFDSLKDTRLPLDTRQELGRTRGLAADG